MLKQVFRSCTNEEMPLLPERLACLREAGQVLYEVSPQWLLFELLSVSCIRASGSDMTRRNTNATL